MDVPKRLTGNPRGSVCSRFLAKCEQSTSDIGDSEFSVLIFSALPMTMQPNPFPF